MATEAELRKKVATWGDDYLGIPEGGSKHKALVNLFNDSGLCTRYKMTIYDAWCAMFASDAFIATNLTDIFPCVECSCASMITLAKKAGIWVEDDSYKPSQGDLVLYDWDDSGSGDNTGTPDHVGIVYSVSGNSFKAIEGNKSDTVGYRSMTVNGKFIRGFITPDYAKAADGKTDSGTTSGTTGGTTGSTEPYTFTETLSVDGEIGNKTVKRWQTVMGQTGKSNVDGFIDGQYSSLKKYWTAIISEACSWGGGTSPVVKKWQNYLIGKGYSCGSSGADGKLGKDTAKATQRFLIAQGYSCGSKGVDGYFGTNSAKAFQKWLNAQK